MGAGANQRIASLDVLRLLFCAAVILDHASGWRGEYTYSVSRALAYVFGGGLAVNGFFVLSGFVITRLLLKAKVTGEPVRYFLLRRAFRIFPAYFLLLVGTAIAMALWPAWFGGARIHWSQWSYCYNYFVEAQREHRVYAHLWSLGVEEQGYVVWPLLLAGLSVASSRRLLTWGIIPATAVCILLTTRNQWLLFGIQCRGLPLALGALLAYRETWARTLGRWQVVAMLAMAVVGFRLWYPALSDTRNVRLLGSILLAVSIVLAALTILEPWMLRRAWTRPAWLTEAGMVTYGLYLYHGSTSLIVGRFPVGYRVPGLVVLTLGLAIASYLLMERPLIQWAGRRFRGNPASNNHADANARQSPGRLRRLIAGLPCSLSNPRQCPAPSMGTSSLQSATTSPTAAS